MRLRTLASGGTIYQTGRGLAALGSSEQIVYHEMTSGWRYQRYVLHLCLPAVDTGLFIMEARSIQQIQGSQQIFPSPCDYLLGSLNLLENCLSLIEGTTSTSGTLLTRRLFSLGNPHRSRCVLCRNAREIISSRCLSLGGLL